MIRLFKSNRSSFKNDVFKDALKLKLNNVLIKKINNDL